MASDGSPQMASSIEQCRLQIGLGELHLPPRGMGIQFYHRDIGGGRGTGSPMVLTLENS